MKKKKTLLILIAAGILALGIGVGAYAASAFGSQSDPLIAKSYLDDVYAPDLRSQFESETDTKVQQLEQQITSVSSVATGSFQTVTVSYGQTLRCTAGSEFVLRSGSANAFTKDGISDLTAGSVVSSGSQISANHLCAASAADDGLTATGSVTVLVRGVYSVS